MSATRRQLPVLSPPSPAEATVITVSNRRRGRPKSAVFLLNRLLNRLAAILVLAMAMAVVIGSRSGTPVPPDVAASASASGQYILADVERGNLSVKVAATGTVEPVRLIEVSTQLSGMIKAVHVENNAIVKTGQLLAELDDETLRHEEARASAQVSVARAKLAEAEALEVAAGQELARKSTLARRNLSPQRDLDNAGAEAAQRKAATEAARAELAAAQAALAMSRSNLAKSRILSPIDGIVLRRNVEPGQTIAASLAAPVLFRLAQSLDRMQIRVDVDEADVMKVKSGQPATFSVQAMRERRLEARVEKLFVGPEIVQGVVTYKAILSFDNARFDLKPGMTATAEIIVEQIRGGMLVPNAALRFSPPDAATQPRPGTGIAFADNLVRAAGSTEAQAAAEAVRGAGGETGRVFIERAGVLAPVLVETGATDGERTVVLSGPLAPGQRVVVDLNDRPR